MAVREGEEVIGKCMDELVAVIWAAKDDGDTNRIDACISCVGTLMIPR